MQTTAVARSLLSAAANPTQLAVPDRELGESLHVLHDAYEQSGSWDHALEAVLSHRPNPDGDPTPIAHTAGGAPGRLPHDWAQLILEAAVSRPAPTVMARYGRTIGNFDASTFSGPDSREYAVKGGRAGGGQDRSDLFFEQLAGHLGKAMEAPVADVCLAVVPSDVAGDVPESHRHFPAVTHASRWVPNSVDEAALIWEGWSGRERDRMKCWDQGLQRIKEAENLPANRPRLARYYVMAGWLGVTDCQFVYDRDSKVATSVDHGATDPDCDIANLPAWSEYQSSIRYHGMQSPELDNAVELLSHVTDQQIAEGLAAAPFDWGMTLSQRVMMAQNLAFLRDHFSEVVQR
jgi:hypothetical protein